MTRINVAVKPAELNDKMLIAEHREIKRIPNCIRKGRYSLDGQPASFKLGTGHVKFFYDKCGYLYNRYQELHKECILRGFNVQNYSEAWDNIPSELMNDYKPSKQDRELIIERIKTKGANLIRVK